MARTDKAPALASLTKAQLIALLTAAPAEPSEASQHFTARDLPCPTAGDKCRKPDGTIRMFRSQGGLDAHAANFPKGRTHDNAKAK